MSEVKVHKVQYRLARQLKSGAMISTATALGVAKDRVKKIEPKVLAAIEEEFARQDAAFADLTQGEAIGLIRMYGSTNRLLGLAGGAHRLENMGKAALSLCDLLDSMNGVVPTDLRPIRVHLDALRILKTDLDERDQEVVLAGLTQVRAHKAQKTSASGL